MYGSKNRFGFTTVELMVVIGIMSIMGAIAIPTYYSWLPNIHFRDASQNLQLDMNYAKMTAVKRNAKVHIRFVDTGACPASSAAFPGATSSYSVAAENDDGTEDTLRNVTLANDVTLCDCGAGTTYSNDIKILANGLPDILSETSTCVVNNKGRKSEVKINLTGNITLDSLRSDF